VIRRTRKVADPGAEFKKLNAKMTSAWIAQDYDSALHWGLEAVKVNPDVFELHGTIAEILIKQNRKEDAIGALITGVHASKNSENWWYVVNRLEELEDSGIPDVRSKLMYCYTSIIRLKGDDYQARKMRMRGYVEQGLLVRARNDAKKCLQTDPGDIEVLKGLAEISASLDKSEEAAPFFKGFIEKCMQSENPDDTHLTWEMVNWYIDTLIEAKSYEEALKELNTVSRWLLGRSDEAYWDGLDDDREWDIDDEPRRVAIPEFENRMTIPESYGEGLPIELRVKLGIIRLGLGEQYLDEALHHFQYLQQEYDSAAVDYADLFHEAGDALRVAGHHEHALRFYEPLKNLDSEVMDFPFYFDLAIAYHGLGRKQDMTECMEHIKQTANGRDPRYQLGLAKLYRAMGREDLMWKLIVVLKRAGKRQMVRSAGLPLERPVTLRTVVDADMEEDEEEEGQEAATPETPPIGAPIYETVEKDGEVVTHRRKATAGGIYKPRKRKLNEEEEILKDTIAKSIYAEIRSLSSAVEAQDLQATKQYLQLCSELFEDFRNQKAFFPMEKYIPFAGFKRTRQVRIPDASSLLENPSVEFEIPTDYRTIDFDDWVDLLNGYAIGLAKARDSKACWTVLETAEDANIILQNEDRIRLVKTTGLACALILGEDKRLCERGRWFIKAYPFQTDTFRLYSILNRACRGTLTWYNAGPEQKFLLRQVKMMDFSLLTDEQRKALDKQGFQTDREAASKNEGNPFGLERHDPALLALYGHVMLVGASYGNALAYYFRAFAMVPEDPVLCLGIAAAYVGLAFKRQTVERQYMVQQGLSFLQKYYDIRTRDGVAVHEQEAEFNMALMWHKLGLLHLAMERYERVLALSEGVREERWGSVVTGQVVEDFAVDAAFAMRTILAVGGDVEGARRVTEKWLVLE
jgi:general transcription factor 3C polypeptide 3 (transcription factor C subunit 4)